MEVVGDLAGAHQARAYLYLEIAADRTARRLHLPSARRIGLCGAHGAQTLPPEEGRRTLAGSASRA